MNYQEFKNQVFETAREKGLTEYELYYQETQGTSIGAFRGEVNDFSSSNDAGACLRCVCGGHIGYASTSLFDREEAQNLVERAMENAASMEKEEPILFCRGGLKYTEVTPKVIDDIPTAEMIGFALDALKRCREVDPRVTDSSMANVEVQHIITCLDNSNGVHLQKAIHLGATIPQVIVTDGGETCDAYEIKLGNPREIDLDESAKKTVQKALDKMGAGVPDSGKYPLVLSPEAMGNMLAVFSSAFSAENVQNGLSLMKDKEGTQIAAECVTLMDNPFYEESYDRSPFDAEGTPTRCKAVVENGMLTTLLHNMATAAKAGVESTGNAYRGSVDSPIKVSPTNFYFRPGQYTAEELYEKAGDGILVTGVGGLHAGADFVTGDFSLQSSGFLIRGGKKAEPVKSFTIAGNFYEMLKDVVALGNDLKLGLSCFGSPSVLVKEITVAGK